MNDENEIQDLFLNNKPVDLLMQLAKPNARHYASALSKDVDVTYSHTVKCLQDMNEMGIVEFEKKGRKKIINLTDLGETLATKFNRLNRACGCESSEPDSMKSGDSKLSFG